tara:strand:- start:480 stop:713 length:234 start_codon:yes stop_codon:yes gene_type:complete
MMKDPLIKYLLNSKGYASVMKGVPLEYMENAKDLTSEVLNTSRSDMYVMYRGPRTGNGNSTLRKDAHSFDLYLRGSY